MPTNSKPPDEIMVRLVFVSLMGIIAYTHSQDSTVEPASSGSNSALSEEPTKSSDKGKAREDLGVLCSMSGPGIVRILPGLDFSVL